MNTRNKNGRIHAAFSILDTALCGFSSATSHSRSSCSLGEINPLDKYCPAVFLRRFVWVPGAVWRGSRRNVPSLQTFGVVLAKARTHSHRAKFWRTLVVRD